MNVFISYSVQDLALVRQIANHLQVAGERVFRWDDDKEPGREVWPQIHNWIDQSDLVLAVITDNTVSRAMAVSNEIGRAKARGIVVIPLVSDNVRDADLGCLAGVTYVKIDPSNPALAIEQLKHTIASLKQKSSREVKAFLIGLGIIVALCFLSKE